jgi:ABC-type sugar transport system ATPase subunit
VPFTICSRPVNPFKAIGRGAKKVVTAPVRVVRNTSRLLKIRSEAEDVLIVAEEAEADPRLYRTVGWWKRLLKEAYELYVVLPIAQEVRAMLEALSGKKTYILAIAAGVTLAAQLAGFIDEGTAAAILSFLGVGGAVTLRSAIAKVEQK